MGAKWHARLCEADASKWRKLHGIIIRFVHEPNLRILTSDRIESEIQMKLKRECDSDGFYWICMGQIEGDMFAQNHNQWLRLATLYWMMCLHGMTCVWSTHDAVQSYIFPGRLSTRMVWCWTDHFACVKFTYLTRINRNSDAASATFVYKVALHLHAHSHVSDFLCMTWFVCIVHNTSCWMGQHVVIINCCDTMVMIVTIKQSYGQVWERCPGWHNTTGDNIVYYLQGQLNVHSYSSIDERSWYNK
jgi:hypothetical protein